MTEPAHRHPAPGSVAAERLDELARRFRAPLLRYFVSKIRVSEDAEELVHEVFVRLLRRADLGEIDNIEAFVFVVAKNILKDHYRHNDRHGAGKFTSIDKVTLKSTEPSPSELIEGRDEIGVLLRSIEELPPKCRAVFVLFRFEDVPHAEIARRMGITVSMVEKHIAAALVQLRKKLRDAGDDKATSHD
ncbi:MAG: sigma-70 family RNA polymerase sigma factor [Hyphomonadaceae bacterium JAD_PAG50586_4]|nr:MAG: sigma-70 family RNA polymerase sigma factor [Hyphomonadaceae bacterium JAD_PAG50586_4]